jgi:alkylation response protein AidB-like acyl-CoA dehydrogenase
MARVPGDLAARRRLGWACMGRTVAVAAVATASVGSHRDVLRREPTDSALTATGRTIEASAVTTLRRSDPEEIPMSVTERPTRTLLSPEMLERFDARAPVYDEENRFFAEDFEELRESGYLLAAVPEHLGGSGLTLAEVAKLQRRLAYYAPATAVAVNMHLYWTGAAADLVRMGDDRMAWVLEAAAAGEVFAAGHGERGNDIPALLSTSEAERVEGGWRISGHKIFGSLSPVWSYLGVHAMDTSDPSAPQVVHAFIPRDADGLRVVETWDTIGMRATASHDTILESVFVADEHVALVTPAGFAGATPFHLAMFAWGLLGFGAVYLGIADRAYDLTIASAHRRTSIALTRSMAYHPGVQNHVAEMRIAIEGATAHLERTCDDWSTFADHGADWPVKLIGTKFNVVTHAWRVVDTAMDLSGGAGIFRSNRMAQLFRDARLGRIHPGNDLFTHETVGKLSLGIDPDSQPRWG